MRGVLGIGAALVMPATLSTITSTSRPSSDASVGAWAGVAGASAILGLLASGVLARGLVLACGVRTERRARRVAIVGTARVIPESADPGARRSWTSSARRSPSRARTLVYSVIEAPRLAGPAHAPWSASPRAVILLGAFIAWELPTRTPADRTPGCSATVRSRPATLSITCSSSRFFGSGLPAHAVPAAGRGQSPLVAALSLVPMALAMMPAARIAAPRLAAHAGALRTACSA